MFNSLDLDEDTFISYEDYFRFLKEYLGSKSYAAGLVNRVTVKEEAKKELSHSQPMDLVNKYSKYETNKNIQGQSKPIGINILKNSINTSLNPDKNNLGGEQASLSNSKSPNTNESNLANSAINRTLNNNLNSSNAIAAINDKKPRAPSGSGIELTISNKQIINK